MAITILLTIILALPLIGAGVLWYAPKDYKKLTKLHAIIAFVCCAFELITVSQVVYGGSFLSYGGFLFVDSVGAVFLCLIAVTGLLVNLYAISYIKWEIEKEKLNFNDARLYFAMSHIFIFTMTFSVVANNIALMWAAIEATTLSSVFMVAIHKSKKSTESGWKYIVICSIGLAFALYATVLLYSIGFNELKNTHDAMLWTTLMANAKSLNPDALKLIFIFALIGFGTKAGLAPTHTWLPDVHSEGPAPASAMLSGILLKCAILGLIRYYAIVGNSTVGFAFVEGIMVVSALITILLASLFLLRQHDVKRMFAYHSIAHMGVVAFGLGVGGRLGLYAALFHCMAHSVTKALAFCVTGNMQKIYGTRDMTKMGGLIHIAPITAILFGIAVASLVGVPACAIFVSEFLMVKQSIASGLTIPVVIFCIGLVIIFVADFSHFNLATYGKSNSPVLYGELDKKANLPLIGLAALIIIFGVFSVSCWNSLLENAVKILMIA